MACPGGRISARRLRRRLRGGGGAGKYHPRQTKGPLPVAPGRRIYLPGALRHKISTPAPFYQSPAMTVNASRIFNPSSAPTSSGMILAKAWQSSGGESSTVQTRSRRSFGSSFCSLASPSWGESVDPFSPQWRKRLVTEGNAIEATVTGGSQSRCVAVWARCTRRSRACVDQSTRAT